MFRSVGTNPADTRLMTPIQITLKEVHARIGEIIPKGAKAFGVPTGGAVVAALHGNMVEAPEFADVIVDDLIDSGHTRAKWFDLYPDKPFLALFDKQREVGLGGKWLQFPWEKEDGGIEEHIRRLLEFIGEDATRPGLLETPHRVAKAYKEMTQGYGQKPEDVLKLFEDGAEKCDEMVVITDIPFYSLCEHHMLPFFGSATVAYIPDGKIMGLSKASRLLDIFAKRLQVQERLTTQVAEAMREHLSEHCAVMIRARHLCMESRGVQKQGHFTQTTAVRGNFRDLPEARSEFMTAALSKLA